MSPDPHAPTPAGPDPDDTVGAVAAGEAADRAADGAPEPTLDAPEPTLDAPAPTRDALAADDATQPTPTVPIAAATPETPAGTAAPEEDWLKADSGVATPAPDPVISTPTGFTPPGTPEDGLLAQAQALTERPEVMVGLAFVGGAMASFVLKRFGR